LLFLLLLFAVKTIEQCSHETWLEESKFSLEKAEGTIPPTYLYPPPKFTKAILSDIQN
jgi:hypothetical protein